MKRVLIISGKTQAKAQLRQILSHVKGLQISATVGSIAEAAELVAGQPFFHFIFVGSELPEAEVAPFVSRTKEKRSAAGDKPVFVLVLPASESDSQKIASNMMAGFHGFLCEPFSLDSVVELTKLAAKVSEQHTVVRLKAATGILLSDLRDEDQAEKKSSPPAKDLYEKSQQSCKWYNRITNESLTTMIATKFKGATLSDCWNGVKALRDKVQSKGGVANHLRVFFKNVIPPSKGRGAK